MSSSTLGQWPGESCLLTNAMNFHGGVANG